MKTALISSVLLISSAVTPAFAQGEDSRPAKEPMVLSATQMDTVRAGALINVNALNNVGVAANVNAQVAALSGLRVDLPRVQPEAPVLELADHRA